MCKIKKMESLQIIMDSNMNTLSLRESNCIVYYLFLFSMIIKKEYIPSHFRYSVIVPIFKGGKKDKLDTCNYRGFALQSILCKLYESILSSRISEVLKQTFDISNLQGACVKGISSLHCSLLLHETIVHNVEKGNDVYVTYFDTKAAFDYFWINGLFYKMYNKGITGKLWRLLKKSNENNYSAVFVNGLTDWFRVNVVVKQGRILSMLF